MKQGMTQSTDDLTNEFAPDAKKVKHDEHVQDVADFPELLDDHVLEILLRADLKSLLQHSRVSKQWLRVAYNPAIWQGLIRRFFPRLEQEQPEDFKTKPFALFRDKFTQDVLRIKEYEGYESMRPFLVDSLEGSIEILVDPENKLSKESQTRLVQIAAANGHSHAVHFLYSIKLFMEPSYGMFIWSRLSQRIGLNALRHIFYVHPLMRQSAHGDLEGLQLFADFIQLAGENVDYQDPKLILARLAAANGHPLPIANEIFWPLFIHKQELYILAAVCGHQEALLHLNDPNKFQALIFAAMVSSCSVFKMILTNAGIPFTYSQKYEALVAAISFGQIQIVQYFFQELPTIIGNRYHCLALLETALRCGQIQIADFIWDKIDTFEFLTIEDKKQMLNAATAFPPALLKCLNKFAPELSFFVEYQPFLIDLLGSLYENIQKFNSLFPAKINELFYQLGLLITDTKTLVIFFATMPNLLNFLKSSTIAPEFKERLVESAKVLKTENLHRHPQRTTRLNYIIDRHMCHLDIEQLDSLINILSQSLDAAATTPPAMITQYDQLRLSSADPTTTPKSSTTKGVKKK